MHTNFQPIWCTCWSCKNRSLSSWLVPTVTKVVCVLYMACRMSSTAPYLWHKLELSSDFWQVAWCTLDLCRHQFSGNSAHLLELQKSLSVQFNMTRDWFDLSHGYNSCSAYCRCCGMITRSTTEQPLSVHLIPRPPGWLRFICFSSWK